MLKALKIQIIVRLVILVKYRQIRGNLIYILWINIIIKCRFRRYTKNVVIYRVMVYFKDLLS